MYLVNIADVKPGMRLGEDISASSGRLLLARGVELKPRYLAALKGIGYPALYVQDHDTSDIPVPQIIPPAMRAKVSRNLAHSFQQVAHCAPELRQASLEVAHEHLNSDKFARSVKAFVASGGFQTVVRDVDSLLDNLAHQDVLVGLNSIKTHDNYTFQHSIDVAILGIMIGRKVGWDRERLRAFGVGCLLHDIGKVFIDPDVLNKPSQLSAEEFEVMKAHPALGYQFIKAVAPTMGSLSPQVAYQHHERQDGSGYPRGIRGDNMLGEGRPNTIHDFGSLAAVADVYDAMASDRPYRAAWTTDQIMRLLVSTAGTHLNRKAVELMTVVVAPYPVCGTIRVLNGRYAGFLGIVTDVIPEAMDRPRIRLLYNAEAHRIDPVELDLRVERDTFIRCERELVPAKPATNLPKPREIQPAVAA